MLLSILSTVLIQSIDKLWNTHIHMFSYMQRTYSPAAPAPGFPLPSGHLSEAFSDNPSKQDNLESFFKVYADHRPTVAVGKGGPGNYRGRDPPRLYCVYNILA